MADRLEKKYLTYSMPNSILDRNTGGKFVFCLKERRVFVCGQQIDLTAREFDARYLFLIN